MSADYLDFSGHIADATLALLDVSSHVDLHDGTIVALIAHADQEASAKLKTQVYVSI